MPIQAGPTAAGAPGAGGNLDGPPPAPGSMRSPDYTNLADNQQANPQGGPSVGLVQIVLQQAQILDQGVKNLAQMLPTFAPIAAQIQGAIKQAVAQAIQQVSGGGGGGQPGGGGPPQGPPAAPATGGAPPPGQ